MTTVVVRLLGGEQEELQATVAGDLHRLRESALSAPLAEGDLVRCAADGRVIDVVEPADAVLTVFAAEDGHDSLVALWTATGAGTTRRAGPLLVTTWPGVPMDAVAQQLNSDEDRGLGQWLLAAEPHERRRDAQDEIDFGPPG